MALASGLLTPLNGGVDVTDCGDSLLKNGVVAAENDLWKRTGSRGASNPRRLFHRRSLRPQHHVLACQSPTRR